MKNMTEFLEEFMTKTGYPEDSKDTFRDLHAKLLSDEKSAAEFDEIIEKIEAGARKEMLAEADILAESMGVHPYTMELFVFMVRALPLRARYAAKGIDESIYWDSMTDLRAKLIECRDVYGINGSFVASWFFGFFDMTRFSLGRLQFEKEPFGFANGYTYGKYTVTPETPVINTHIPSLGPLPIESVLDAFSRAYNSDLFRDMRIPGTDICPFVCHSWLLYPAHYDFLPKKSNILRFMDCFDIYESSEETGFGNQWRVFGKDKDTAPENLPTDTSLRRAYAERLRTVGKSGHGSGIVLFDGQKIINR